MVREDHVYQCAKSTVRPQPPHTTPARLPNACSASRSTAAFSSKWQTQCNHQHHTGRRRHPGAEYREWYWESKWGEARVCTWIPVGLVNPNFAVASPGGVIGTDGLLFQGLLGTNVGLLEKPRVGGKNLAEVKSTHRGARVIVPHVVALRVQNIISFTGKT